ncbi:MAG: hypothetical protein A3J97_10705 [Spirochaetes bacterium RIFOXYC1_FULL_54_7]|nr:MAG: hypothetical protein A3J97_10705 [Spirochaetes bacterium RIFOXYC1_FULL_54_7]
MAFDAKLGTQSVIDKQIINGTHPAIVLPLDMKADNGSINVGQMVAKDSNGDIVAYDNDIEEDLGDGDAAVERFTGILASYPVAPGSVSVSDGTQELVDDGEGNLVGDGDGYVNYKTGAISVKFAAPPASLAEVVATYANKPEGVLVQTVDTTKETVGRVIVHGTVVAANILVAAVAAAAADFARMEPQVYAI